ncbi:MAG: alpha/beta fold hydrolase [Caldilineaceae bacterium]
MAQRRRGHGRVQRRGHGRRRQRGAPLGYATVKLVGIDFGSQLALEIARSYPTTVDRLALILPIGPDQLLKLPANVQSQLERLAQLVQNDPQLAPRIPDFLALMTQVLTRLEAQPVTVTIRDPATPPSTSRWASMTCNWSPRALTNATQWSLPTRYYEMGQGDFTWLARQAYAWRTGITANLTNLTALCASGASAERRAQADAQAPATLLGDAINAVYFDLCTAVGDPDLGDAFRGEITTDAPTLFIAGTMDAYAPVANVEELAAGFANVQTVTVNNGTHDLLDEAMPELAPILTDFMLDDPLTPLAVTSVAVASALEPVRIEPVTTLVWRGQYFNNRNLQGDPTIVRDDPAIDFDWGEGSPSPDINPDNFSVRWTTTTDLPAGTYRVSLWVDDGVRMWVDDVLVVDQWVEGTARNFITDINLVRGPHNVRIEYFEAEGLALARMTVARVENYPEWRTEYFDNVDLAGAPVVVRNEQSINYNWGTASPVIGVPADNFSVRGRAGWRSRPASTT